MKKKCRAGGIAKMLASIGIFAGLIGIVLGIAVYYHADRIMENGLVHAIITDTGEIHAKVTEERKEKKRRKGQRRRHETSYRITWYQDLGIRSEETDIARVSMDFDEQKVGYRPSREDLVPRASGYEINQELEIFITDEGRAFPAERMKGNRSNAQNIIYAGICAFGLGAASWACILAAGRHRRKRMQT